MARVRIGLPMFPPCPRASIEPLRVCVALSLLHTTLSRHARRFLFGKREISGWTKFAAGRLSESWAGDQSALGQFQCLALIKHE